MRQISYQEFPNQRRFGVELEVSNNLSKQEIGGIINEYEFFYGLKKKNVKVTSGIEGWAQTRDNAYWHVKFDRTCGPLGKKLDYGWEIASYIGSGVEDVNHISRLARFLQNAGAEVNLNCGLHVHVEVKDFNDYKMGVLLSRWLKIENFLLMACHPSRTNNQYCMPIRRKIGRNYKWYSCNDPEAVWNTLCPYDLSVHNNYDKRVTLNTIGFATATINPFFTRNTVELRLPECLLDELHVKNWIRLIVNFVETSHKTKIGPQDIKPAINIQEALTFLGLSGEEEFLFLCPDLISTKIWFLRKIIQNSQNQKIINQAKKHLDFITLI
jgi:hypothetical protein